jgi:Na+/H+-dicarboxylate symporter
MCRTITNVTGDAAVSMMVAHSFGKLKEEPHEKKWDDNYPTNR